MPTTTKILGPTIATAVTQAGLAPARARPSAPIAGGTIKLLVPPLRPRIGPLAKTCAILLPPLPRWS